MKIICFILALFTFCLATVPCCAEDNCKEDLEVSHSNTHPQDLQGSERNTCSPFLTCGPCAGFIFPSADVNFMEVFFNKVKRVTIFKTQIASDYFAEIRQPPKIS
jgi:hypothetical protein